MSTYTNSLSARALISYIAHAYGELSRDKVVWQQRDLQRSCRDWLIAHPSSDEQGREVIEFIASVQLDEASANDSWERDAWREQCAAWLKANREPNRCDGQDPPLPPMDSGF